MRFEDDDCEHLWGRKIFPQLHDYYTCARCGVTKPHEDADDCLDYLGAKLEHENEIKRAEEETRYQ